MEIKRLGIPNPPASTTSTAKATGAFADKVAEPAPVKDAARTMEILLDRVAEKMGGLPDGAREALKAQLAEDPYFQGRLSQYLEKQGE